LVRLFLGSTNLADKRYSIFGFKSRGRNALTINTSWKNLVNFESKRKVKKKPILKWISRKMRLKLSRERALSAFMLRYDKRYFFGKLPCVRSLHIVNSCNTVLDCGVTDKVLYNKINNKENKDVLQSSFFSQNNSSGYAFSKKLKLQGGSIGIRFLFQCIRDNDLSQIRGSYNNFDVKKT
jgi:hypothetical protein